jgi:transposase
MDYHYHARLVVHSREQLARSVLEGRLSLKEAAASFKLSRQSAAKWVGRYRDQGVAGLNDRSSRPHRSPRGTSEERIMEIEQLRRQRWTGVRIALELGLSQATISRVLRRLKLNRIRHIAPQLPPNRYEHAAPGDLLHLDIKRLVRIQRPSHRVTGDRRDGVKGIGARGADILTVNRQAHVGIIGQVQRKQFREFLNHSGCIKTPIFIQLTNLNSYTSSFARARRDRHAHPRVS